MAGVNRFNLSHIANLGSVEDIIQFVLPDEKARLVQTGSAIRRGNRP